MALTDLEIRSARATEKPVKLFDGGGLYLLVNPNGNRWWRFKYRFDGKERAVSLGVYPDVSLKLARTRRDEARQMVADGLDPSAERKAVKKLGKLLWNPSRKSGSRFKRKRWRLSRTTKRGGYSRNSCIPASALDQ